ncbi:coiled-coil domain-containing protein 66 isoform X5 [Anas platyrhynchos]|uniref:coiled-coil domain-containing protein 66 isoform X5 n=1 Tax=Anas platyrhynchos TaxID=8839 RepID=UPI0018D789AB|nr:coiled-coil domain-containing protein 66 isoform X5 [Anas platyrhynchos]
MNLGDGLKLETEVLDGKPRLILASYDKSRLSVKMGNKGRVPKQALRIRHTGHILRSTQNACIKQENLAKPRTESSLSMTKGEKMQVTRPSSNEATDRDHSLIFQRDNTNRKTDSENLDVKKSKQRHQNPHIHVSAEDLGNLVCLTQEQLQQILMTVEEGTRSIFETHNEKQEETAESSEENTSFLEKCYNEVSSVPDEVNSNSSRKQESYLQQGQKVTKESWKPADMFTTLGEREGEKALLEFKKTRWKKELDEQVALKKKLKETLEEEVGCFWAKSGNEKTHTEKMGTANPDKEAVPQEQPSKHEQQKKWLEELDKQKEEAKLRKTEEKLNLSKAEEHDRWAMHFDSLKNHLNANAQHPLNGMYKKQPESLCLSPDPKELTAFVHPFSPAALGNLMPSKVENAEKVAKSSALDHSQKVSFLRSMTALLDPAQIEERDRRRQKQLEHQKAIMAQVEEKRKKKQLEEEKRKWEEHEEEQRLAREKELIQKQFEEDMLKQKQKEELVTLKTNEIYHTMQKAQELAQRLKQEQRIQDLAQKGHDISKLKKNLGDDCNTSACIDSVEGRTMCCGSPDISTEYKETSNSNKYQKEMQYTDKNKISGQENGGIYSELYEQYARKERQVKSSEKNTKRPDWNINKPGKRYIPASERYPKQLQKQREANKVRRQMELLQLVERNTPRNLCPKNRSPSPHEEMNMKNKRHRIRKEEQLHKNNLNEERSDSPVPAVKNRLHEVQQKQTHTSNFLVHNNNSRREKNIKTDAQQRSSPPLVTEAGRPPSSQFIPYVRTNEVYYLDPEAPVTRPSTHDPQYQQLNDSYQTPRQIFSSDHTRDPLLNPDVVKIRERQQAILKGLSELRQGLLQKQKELESGLIPTITQEENFISPF